MATLHEKRYFLQGLNGRHEVTREQYLAQSGPRTSGLAEFQEIELFYFYPEHRNQCNFAVLLRDTITDLGICWCKNVETAERLLRNSGYEYRTFNSGVCGCWYRKGGAV